MCVLCAAPPAAVGPVHQQLQGEEERRAGPAGPGAGRRLQGWRGPRASRKAAGPLHEPVLVFVVLFFFGFSRWRVVAGVLQQPRGDVVPQGDDRVVTLSRRPLLHSPSSSYWVGRQSGGRQPITAWPARRTMICSARNIRLFFSRGKKKQVKALPTLRAALEGQTGVSFSVEFLDLHHYIWFLPHTVTKSKYCFLPLYSWSIINKFNIISRQPTSFLLFSRLQSKFLFF